MIWRSKEMIDEEFVVELSQKINELQEDEKLYWYFNSYGGETHVGFEVIDIINRNKDRIELIASDNIFSTAFLIFFKAQCERKILPLTFGMMHCASTSFEAKHEGKIAIFEKERRSKFLAVNEFLLNWCRDLGFTESELKKFKKAEDIHFDTKALHNLLEQSKELNANLINS